MSRISVTNLTINIGARTLVRDANLNIDKGMRIGMVGRNGAGKTTTMKLLAGVAQTEGVIEYSGHVSGADGRGYLTQNPADVDTSTSGQERILSVRGLDATIARIRKAEHEMATQTGARQQKAMERYVRLDQEFHMSGGYAANAQAFQIAANLGLSKETLKQPLDTLSGGQRRRVELARVLFSQADVLLLDEPTNHLDHDAVLWLRDYLRSYPGAFVVISHSVELIRDVVNQIWYLDATRATIDQYNLGWDAYLKARAEDEARRTRERAVAMKKAARLREQGERLRAGTRAVAAQVMLRRAAELEASLAPVQQVEKVARLRFPTPQACGKVPLEAEGLAKSYGSLEVFAGVDLAIDRGSKVVVLGPNGAGKTTLLRLLSGVEQADAGRVIPGHGLKLGYYAQEHEFLDPTLSVLDNMAQAAPDFDDTQVRNILGQFLFSGEDTQKSAGVLSGGERTRLALATLVVSGANVLLLDEPTNNLDPASRAEILEALRNYEGAVILVTHDQEAVLALEPDRVLLLPDGDEDMWDEDYLELVTLT